MVKWRFLTLWFHYIVHQEQGRKERDGFRIRFLENAIVPGGRVCEFPPVEVSRGQPTSAEVSRGQPINTKATTRQISAGQKNRRATA